MTILQHFLGEPREAQKKALLEIERLWSTHSVFVLRAPVGSGKSRILKCLVDWAGGGALLTPNNILVQQYCQEFSDLRAPRSRAEFGQEAWARYRRGVFAAPKFLGNYYNYLSLKAYKPLVCFDEAHNLVSFLQDMEEVKVWLNQPLPSSVQTTADLLLWALQEGHEKLVAALSKHPDNFQVSVSSELYRGKSKLCLRVRPLTPQDNKPILWPNKVKKLVLASATFHVEDLKDLGLDTRTVAFIDTESAIPAERRPVYFRPAACLTKEGQAAGGLGELVQALEDLARSKPSRGLVHVTYALAEELRGKLSPRFLFHRSDNKSQQLSAWLRSEDKILVGAGLSEGLDLAYDKARWQVVAKVVYPNIADPAVFQKARSRPEWYQWSAVKTLLQATGRVCRGPEDFGETFVLDDTFERLYDTNLHLFPSWFKVTR